MYKSRIFKSKILCIGLIALTLLVVNRNILPVQAVVYQHEYFSLSDLASRSSSAEEGGGGDAYANAAGDVDTLKLRVDTDGLFEWGRATHNIDGGAYDNSPWQVNYHKTYMIKIYWYIKGNYNEEGSNYFKFTYVLKCARGTTIETVLQYTYEYTNDFSYLSLTSINHYLGSAYLHSDYKYYLEVEIKLYHSWTTTDSNMYSDDKKIDFWRADFYYPIYTK